MPCFVDEKFSRRHRFDQESKTSTISSEYMSRVLEKLKQNKKRDSTKRMYHNVWNKYQQVRYETG